MVLERANRTLSWVCTVIVGIGELILEVLGGDGHVYGVGDLVVEFVKDWDDPYSLQFGIASIVPLNEVFCLPALNWMDKDCIGVMIIEEKDIVHTMCGGKWKIPGLISGDHGVKFIKFNRIGADKVVTGKMRSRWC